MTTKLKISKIRFKEFSGEWEEKKLGEVSNVRDGTHDSPKYQEYGYPLITSKNLLKSGKIDYSNTSNISEEDFININKRSKVDKGDILFGMIGTIGNPVIVDKDDFAIKNVALIKEKKVLINLFLINYLRTHKIEKQFYELNAGGTQKFIALGVIRDLFINIPSLPEQQKIASFISSVDDKIEKIKEKKKNLEEYKKGVMQKNFSQEIRFKDENGEEFGEWEEKKLGEICKINKGTQLNAENLTEKGLYPAMNGGINPSGYNFEFNKLENTITISEGGNSCGYINFIKTKFWCGGHCYALENLKCNNLFLYQILKFNENNIMRLRVGSGLPNIQKKDIENFNIFLPTLKEQEKIANFLSEIDEKIEKVSDELEKMEEFKKGLLQGMFI